MPIQQLYNNITERMCVSRVVCGRSRAHIPGRPNLTQRCKQFATSLTFTQVAATTVFPRPFLAKPYSCLGYRKTRYLLPQRYVEKILVTRFGEIQRAQ